MDSRVLADLPEFPSFARGDRALKSVLRTESIVSAGATPATSEADTQQKYTVADLQARYDALLPKIAKKRKDVKKGRFSLGDEVLNLNLDKSADAIVFIRGRGRN